MKKTVWDFFAPIYETTMKSQKNIYDYLYQNISRAAEGKTVLELATGPGMIAKHIASAAKSVVATDFAPNMIETAKKGDVPQNVTFEVADATSLPYADKSFDLVVIANALHIIPDPQKALAQIKRVLKDGGYDVVYRSLEQITSRPFTVRAPHVLRIAGEAGGIKQAESITSLEIFPRFVMLKPFGLS